MSSLPSVFIVSSSASIGGAEIQLSYLLNALSKFKIHLLVLDQSTFLDELIFHKNLTIYRPDFLRNTRYLAIFSSLLHFIRLYRSEVTSESFLLGWLAKGNIFVLLVQLLSFVSLRTPVFWTHRSSFFLWQSAPSQFLLFTSLFFAALRIYPITHIANSQSVFSPLIVNSLLSGRKVVIHNGFDFILRFNATFSEKQKKCLAVLQRKLLIFFPARFSPEKGHNLLFKALKFFKHDFHLSLVGKGCSSLNKILMSQVDSYREKVTLYDSHVSLRDYYMSAHFSILMSSSESFPNVLVESMAYFTPCISTDVGSCKEIVGECGLVVPKRTVNSVLETLNLAYHCSQDLNKYSKLSLDARERVVSCYPVDLMHSSYLDLF